MIYYTLEKNNGKWVVWKNSERERSCGSTSVFKSEKKKNCEAYCRENNINIQKNKLHSKIANRVWF